MQNALLRLVLEVGGFERRINVATNAAGAFEFSFQPAATDAGRYRVSVRHPDQADPQWQGELQINRVRVSPSTYRLNAARTIADRIPLQVTAGPDSAVTQFRFAVVPADQPSGALPAGIEITPPSPISLAAGGSRTLEVGFLGAANAPAQGTVVLTAFADESGSMPRARVSVPFQLSAPLPALSPQPGSMAGGVRQGGQVSVGVEIVNQGLLAADGVSVELLNAAGTAPAPAWIRLSSPAEIGRIEVGGRAALELTASPDSNVADGVYSVRARVSADNAAAGDVLANISVTQAGDGDLRFHVANIYTETQDANGQTINGLAGAQIRLQHETIPGLQFTATSDADGNATLSNVPVGRYLWRATATEHGDSSGTVQVQPGVQRLVDVFLDIELVSIDWQVTETTIRDQYDIRVNATFLTFVPAPVVLLEPVFVNLPAMQIGEEFTGEITISNYGLVRADNVVFQPAASDAFFRYEFLGEVPNQLDARQRVRLAYRITALQALPASQQQLLATQPAPKLDAPLPLAGQLDARSTASCSAYRNVTYLRYDYECANGAVRNGFASTTMGRTVGQQCSGSGGGGGGGGGGAGGGGGGWGGGGTGTPMSNTPGCTPNCRKCCSAGGAGGGG